MQKKILFAVLFAFAGLVSQAQQKTEATKATAPAPQAVPTIKVNKKRLKTSPASRFTAQPRRRQKAPAATLTPVAPVRS